MFPIPIVWTLQLKLIIAGVVAAVLVATGVGLYIKGYSSGEAAVESKYKQEKLEWEQKVLEVQKDFDKRIDPIIKAYDEDRKRMQDQIRKLQGKKPVVVDNYIPVQTNCTIPKGFVELHNLAAQGKELSDTPLVDASKPSDKTLNQVGTVVATNYYQCNDVINQLKSLQRVVKQYQQQQQEMIKK